jgi:hypothetical protein
MTSDAKAFVEYIGGIPFLDEGFHSARLLTAVACLRRNVDSAAFPSLKDYLEPRNARWLYKEYAKSAVEEFSGGPLSAADNDRVDVATGSILDVCPWWKSLFAFPKRYVKLSGRDLTSVTSALIPQTIYLGDLAFASPDVLVETLIHEHAHVWLNFIAELKDFQHPYSMPQYVLPSGTKGKTLRGVLLAGHFAAAVIVFHRSRLRTAEAGRRPKRLPELEAYLRGCLLTAFGRRDLTAMGAVILERLQAVSQP